VNLALTQKRVQNEVDMFVNKEFAEASNQQ